MKHLILTLLKQEYALPNCRQSNYDIKKWAARFVKIEWSDECSITGDQSTDPASIKFEQTFARLINKRSQQHNNQTIKQ
ncbi:hypothetical protein OC25_07390 [Pedobacter kyungheensis]|uniref:Uncharacterized protein n=1 Tax=Pedobacter kyungheensis TaxID=1069985 RepID=A0A0C1DMB4_9SPHI|nr:hypothetical protein OC25_07390 [Pedobacter kyungheensis]